MRNPNRIVADLPAEPERQIDCDECRDTYPAWNAWHIRQMTEAGYVEAHLRENYLPRPELGPAYDHNGLIGRIVSWWRGQAKYGHTGPEGALRYRDLVRKMHEPVDEKIRRWTLLSPQCRTPDEFDRLATEVLGEKAAEKVRAITRAWRNHDPLPPLEEWLR